MNLFFRRLWVYLRAQLSSKDGAFTDTYSLYFRVWLTDQDAFLHLTNSRYLSFSDLGRLNMLIRSGIRNVLQREDWAIVICSQTRTIARMLKSPQTFEMACQITGWTDEHLAICHRFQRSQKVHAEVNTLVQIQTKAGDVIPIQELLSHLQVSAPSPQLTDVFADLVDRATTTNSTS
ncbi:MAG: thioesterase family protein [Henriciella sp.]